MSPAYDEALKILERFKETAAAMKSIGDELNAIRPKIPPGELMQFQQVMMDFFKSISQNPF